MQPARLNHLPTVALAVATLFWGMAFTWAKSAGEEINRLSGAGEGAAVGPILLLGWRFGLGGVLWLILFGASRRGWTRGALLKVFGVGALLAFGLALQHLGLDRTSEAVSAFLTSLTILFVPLLMTVVLRKPPRGVLWAAVGVAVAGIWLMTGASPSGFGLGEWLGVGCALAFAVYILAVNSAVRGDDPWRMTAGQFVVVGALTLGCAAVLAGRWDVIGLGWHERVRGPMLLLTVFSTMLSYGLLTFFQPRIDPTRAALIYLLEPVFAAIFARVVTEKELPAMVIVGAILILVANGLVEMSGGKKNG